MRSWDRPYVVPASGSRERVQGRRPLVGRRGPRTPVEASIKDAVENLEDAAGNVRDAFKK